MHIYVMVVAECCWWGVIHVCTLVHVATVLALTRVATAVAIGLSRLCEQWSEASGVLVNIAVTLAGYSLLA